MENLIELNKLKVTKEVFDYNTEIMGDRDAIKQIFINYRKWGINFKRTH